MEFLKDEGLRQLIGNRWSGPKWHSVVPDGAKPLNSLVPHMNKLCSMMGKVPSVQNRGYAAYERLVRVTRALKEIRDLIR